MSFLTVQGSFYYRVQKVNISSRDKVEPNDSDLEYQVALRTALKNVVSVTLAEWSFPPSLFPSFEDNNMLDFSLENPNFLYPEPIVYSIILPQRKMNLDDKNDTTASLIRALQTSMMQAIDSRTNLFKNSTQIEVFGSDLFNLMFCVKVPFPASFWLPSDSTTLTLLFDSGPNRDRSAYASLGFPTQTDVSSSTILTLDTPVQAIESPLQTNLTPNKYVDVFIDEMGSSPVKRIFATDATYVTNYSSIDSLSLDVITNNPPRNIDKMHVRIVHDSHYKNKTLPHAYTLHVISLENGVLPTPSYATQQRLVY